MADERGATGQVTVVVAVRNGLPHVLEAVGSALAQGEAIDEVIVVDDGSTDGTSGALQARYPGARLRVVTSPGRGVSTARNAGAAAGRGRWLLFLDADDRLVPGALDTLLAARTPASVIVYGDYERMDDDGRSFGNRRLLRKRRRKPSGRMLEALLAQNVFINGGVLICAREAFERSGGFDPALAIAEDWHLWCRLAALGPVVYVPELVLDYRVHKASVMMKAPRRFEDFKPALSRMFSDPSITDGISARAIRRLRRRAEVVSMTYCAQQALRAGHYHSGIALAAAAVGRFPRRMPWVLGRVVGALAHM